MTALVAEGKRPKKFDGGRLLIYAVLAVASLFFLMPLWVMLMTSFKSMAEIREGQILYWPQHFTADAWPRAWSSACTGLTCDGVRVGFWNSIRILVPSVILSIALGGLTGYAMAFYRVPGAILLFAILLIGAFIPYQVFIYPMVRVFSMIGLYDSLAGIVVVHIIFGLSLMTLLFATTSARSRSNCSTPRAWMGRASSPSFAMSCCRCRRRLSSSRPSFRSPASGMTSFLVSPSLAAPTDR